MAYPDLPTEPGTRLEYADDIRPLKAGNEAVVNRADYSKPWPMFVLPYKRLTNTEKQTLEAFHQANRHQTFDYTWPWNGLTYTCMFGAPPRYTVLPGLHWRADVILWAVS